MKVIIEKLPVADLGLSSAQKRELPHFCMKCVMFGSPFESVREESKVWWDF
jgi:hypothetical protein